MCMGHLDPHTPLVQSSIGFKLQSNKIVCLSKCGVDKVNGDDVMFRDTKRTTIALAHPKRTGSDVFVVVAAVPGVAAAFGFISRSAQTASQRLAEQGSLHDQAWMNNKTGPRTSSKNPQWAAVVAVLTKFFMGTGIVASREIRRLFAVNASARALYCSLAMLSTAIGIFDSSHAGVNLSDRRQP